MRKKYKCHVISATHWDREWVKSFQESRVSLVDMFDELFSIFERDPEFRFFHLDSQTIPLEDYNEVRPENKEKLKALVGEGKLLVGPWYTLPEMNVIDGESVVRNLLIGHRIAREYGNVMKVGYTPTSTGQISQLPQIYAGFGIDSAIFYRGINQELTPAEYIWRSPDGTEAFGIRPPQHFSRCTFWGYLYLPMVHKYYDHIEDSKTQLWHEHGLAFKLAEATEDEYVELKPRKFFDTSYLEQGLERLKREAGQHMTTNVMLALHGHDASHPHRETPEIIRAVNGFSDEIEMVHSDFPGYIAEIRSILSNRETNVVVEGEMRHTNISQAWNDAHLYPGVMSTKGRLKVRNRDVENLLIRHAEPSSSMAFLTGGVYETKLLDMAWKLVLANHAHDTINACSLDEVFDDAMHRIKQAEDLSKQVLKRSLSSVVRLINTSDCASDAVLVTAFNMLPKRRSGLLRLAVDLPSDSSDSTLILKDSAGKTSPTQLISSYPKACGVDKIGFGKSFPAKRYELYAYVEDLPAYGYQNYEVVPCKEEHSQANISLAENLLENRDLQVKIEENGCLTVHHKKTGNHYPGLHYFIDEGEMGNAWTPGRMPGAKVYNSARDGRVDIRLLENGPLRASYMLTITMDLPVGSEADYTTRSKETSTYVIESVIGLDYDAQCIDIETTLQNTVRDHRLRVMFPGSVNAASYYANMPFDVVERPIPKPEGKDWVEPVEASDPQLGFLGVSDGSNGLAVLNHGLYEAEVQDDPDRTIAITLLRSFYQHGNWTKDRWSDEGFQNPGKHSFSYAIYPHEGNWNEGGVYSVYETFINPLRVAQHGQNPEGKLPREREFISVSRGVQISAIKKYEYGQGLVLRLYNPGREDISALIRVNTAMEEAILLDMEELEKEKIPIVDGAIKINISHHRIETLLIR